MWLSNSFGDRHDALLSSCGQRRPCFDRSVQFNVDRGVSCAECTGICTWFKKGSGTVAGTAGHRPKVGRVLRTTVPDPFFNPESASSRINAEVESYMFRTSGDSSMNFAMCDPADCAAKNEGQVTDVTFWRVSNRNRSSRTPRRIQPPHNSRRSRYDGPRRLRMRYSKDVLGGHACGCR